MWMPITTAQQLGSLKPKPPETNHMLETRHPKPPAQSKLIPISHPHTLCCCCCCCCLLDLAAAANAPQHPADNAPCLSHTYTLLLLLLPFHPSAHAWCCCCCCLQHLAAAAVLACNGHGGSAGHACGPQVVQQLEAQGGLQAHAWVCAQCPHCIQLLLTVSIILKARLFTSLNLHKFVFVRGRGG